MTDLAGLFVESEIEAPEVVRAKKSLFTIISRLLFLVGQEFIKSKYFLALHIAVILRIILDTQSFCQCTNGIYALTSSYVPLFAIGRTLFLQLIWNLWLKNQRKEFIFLHTHFLQMLFKYIQKDKTLLILDLEQRKN